MFINRMTWVGGVLVQLSLAREVCLDNVLLDSRVIVAGIKIIKETVTGLKINRLKSARAKKQKREAKKNK